MTAIAWSLVGLMAAFLGVLTMALFTGMGRIDALGARIDALGSRVDAQGTRIDAQSESLGARIDALGSGIRAEIRDLRETVHALDVRVTHAGG